MVEELVFTSAKRGLEIGKSGFCTVASSSGMATNLARLLQSLSGYRHLHPPGSPDAPLNPVVYSHLKSKVGGQSYSIYSRICDADIDYSNRSNKLAHHLALKGSVGVDFTPVEVLQNESQFFVQWDEEPRKLPPKTLTGHSITAVPCATWDSVTGDSGWAGDVVDAVLKNRPVYLIVDHQTPALKLISEAVSLLPRPKQRDVTFSTFFTKIPPSVECGIRCVMAGSPEVALGRRSQKNLVLDLTQSLGQSQSPHADAARTGMLIGGSTGNEFTNISTKPVTPPQQDALELEVDEEYYLKQASLASSESGQSVPPTPPKSGRPTSKQPAKLGDATTVKRSVLPWIIGLVLLLLAGGGAAVFAAMNLVNDSVQVARVVEGESDVVTESSVEPSVGGATVGETENDDAHIESKPVESEDDSTLAKAAEFQPDPDVEAAAIANELVTGREALNTNGGISGSGVTVGEAGGEEEQGAITLPPPVPADSAGVSSGAKPETSNSKPVKKLKAGDFAPNIALPANDEFRTHFKASQPVVEIAGEIANPCETVKCANRSLRIKSDSTKDEWFIEGDDKRIGKLVFKTENGRTTILLEFVGYHLQSGEHKAALKEGLTVDGFPVRFFKRDISFAMTSPNFRKHELKFEHAETDGIELAFGTTSAGKLQEQLGKVLHAKKFGLKVKCKFRKGAIVISVADAPAEMDIEINLAKSEFVSSADKSLASALERVANEIKKKIGRELDELEVRINAKREELSNQQAENIFVKFKWADFRPAKYREEDEEVIAKQALRKLIEGFKAAKSSAEVSLESGDFNAIVVPLTNKKSSFPNNNYYLLFNCEATNKHKKDAKLKIKNWSSK